MQLLPLRVHRLGLWFPLDRALLRHSYRGFQLVGLVGGRSAPQHMAVDKYTYISALNNMLSSAQQVML